MIASESNHVKNDLFDEGFRWFQLFSVILFSIQNHPSNSFNSVIGYWLGVYIYFDLLDVGQQCWVYEVKKVLKTIKMDHLHISDFGSKIICFTGVNFL